MLNLMQRVVKHMTGVGKTPGPAIEAVSVDMLSITREEQHIMSFHRRRAEPLPRPVTAENGSRYYLEAVLGRGGLGIVYQARTEDGRIVAFKKAIGRAESAYIEKEGVVLRELHHQNIVKLLEAGQTAEADPYLVMEYIPGRTLESVLAEGPIKEQRAKVICLQIAAALAHIHSRGLVHRDIKPANVMLSLRDGREHVTVLDFGISGPEQMPDGPPDSSGSLFYSCPELLCEHTFSLRSDIYQLGLVLFECLTGHLPFEKNYAAAVMYRLDGNTLSHDCYSGLGFDMRNLLEKALSPDPEGRHQSAREFAEQLSAARWFARAA